LDLSEIIPVLVLVFNPSIINPQPGLIIKKETYIVTQIKGKL